MEVYSDRIVMGHPGRQWEIPLDGGTERMEAGGRMALYPPQGRMVILPLRCVEPSVLPDVKAAVLAGTRVRQ